MIKKLHRINNQIRARQVRLIDPEGNQLGVVPVLEAIKKAEEFTLDLVEVAPDVDPPVCRILDYNKFLYEQRRKQRQGQKKHHTGDVKEVKFRPAIDKHDYETKLRHVRDFLDSGYKVRITLVYRGREKTHKDLGVRLLKQILEDFKDFAQAEHQTGTERIFDGMILVKKK